MNIEVSVITPAYNAEKTVEETYKSLKEQTFSNWEWVVVNDCSKDKTLDILTDIQKADKRVVVIDCKNNGGAAVARNIAIEKAKGRFIAFVDADDLWKPTKLETQIKFMKDNSYSITCTDYDLFSEDKLVDSFRIKRSSFNYKQMLKRNNVGCSTVMYDSSILGKRYMPLDAPKREDHAAWIDITKDGTTIYKVNESLTLYRVGNNSVSSKKFKLLKFQYILYRKHLKFNVFKASWYTFCLALRKVFTKYSF